MGVRQKRSSVVRAPIPGERLLARIPLFQKNSWWKWLILPRSTDSSKKFTPGFEAGVATGCNLLLPRAQPKSIAPRVFEVEGGRFSSEDRWYRGVLSLKN